MAKFEVVTPDHRLIKTDYAKLIAESFTARPAMYDIKFGVTKEDLEAARHREAKLYDEDVSYPEGRSNGLVG